MRTVMTVVLGVMMAQVLVALFLARWMRAGKGPQVEWKVADSNELVPASETLHTTAAIDNYPDLAALLIALDPQPEKAAREQASVSIRAANTPGPWPGESKQ